MLAIWKNSKNGTSGKQYSILDIGMYFQLCGIKNNHRIDENGRKEKRCCKGSWHSKET